MAVQVHPSSGYCSKTGIYYSKRKPLNLPQEEYLNLPAFLSQQSHSGEKAFIDSATGYTITFPHLWQSVRCLAAGLAEIGIKKGDVILLLSPNSLYFPIICLGIMSVGAIVTTTNPLNTPAEIAKQATDSSAVMAFVTPELVSKLAETNLPLVLISKMPGLSQEAAINGGSSATTRSLGELMETDPGKAPNVRIKQDETATLLYSSGTTGLSKGVITTHRNLISLACIFMKPSTYNNCYLCTVPLFHIFGLAVFACGLLATGSTVVMLSKFELGEMLGAIQKYRVTYLPLVPPIFLAFTKTDVAMKYDLKSLRTVICAAAPLSKELAQEFSSKFPFITVLQAYGLTESTAIGTSTDNEEEGKHYGTAGLLASSTDAKIVDPHSGLPLPPNQRGELWLRGPTIMKGYFSNPEATGSALDENGWLRTGDLCYIDNEGYLFVVDRLKELIKYKGYQVAPAELEGLLISHPQIADVAVIPFPDKEAGEIPMAYVVRKQGSRLSEATLMEFVAKQVAPYKKVRKVAFVSGIPKSASGKILRKDLIKLSTSRL